MADVDDRIVNLRFNNEEFEEGVVATLAALQKLEESLEFKHGVKGFSDIKGAVDSFNLSNMSQEIDEVNNKLGILGIVGATAINELTKKVMRMGSSRVRSITDIVFGSMEGGRERFLAIDEAQFKFRGLGLDVEKAMENANNAVVGTRFSLDAAATAAAQFAGAGVEVGDEMEKSLRSVAGVATQAGMNFEHVSHIFSGIAAMNKVTGHDFQRLESQGFAASQVLADHMGKTREEVKLLAREGKIDFETFRDAMFDAFGDNAAKANETYSGALANVHAGLNRIGADLSEGKLEARRTLFAGLLPVIKELQWALKPLGEALAWIHAYIAQGQLNFAESIDFSRVRVIIQLLIRTFFNFFAMFHQIKMAAKEAWSSVFPSDEGQLMWLVKVTGWLALFTEKLKFGSETADKVKRIFAGFFAIFKLGFLIIKSLFGILKGIISPLTLAADSASGLGGGLLEAFAKVGDFIVKISQLLESWDITPVVETIQSAFGSVYSTIGKLFGLIGSGPSGSFSDILSGIGDALYFISEQARSAISAMTSFLTGGVMSAADRASSVLDTIKGGFGKSGSGGDNKKVGLEKEAKDTERSGSIILTVFAKLGRGLAIITRGIRDAFVGFADGADGMFKNLGVIVGKLVVLAVNGALDFIGAFMDTIVNGINFTQLASTLAGAGVITAIAVAIKKAFTRARKLLSFRDELKTLLSSVSEMFQSFGEAAENATKETIPTKMIKIAGAIAIFAASLWVLSKLDWEQLAIGSAVILGFLGAMVGSIAILQKVADSGTSVGKTGFMALILSLSAAILVFAIAVNLLRGLSPEQIGDSLLALSVGMTVMVGSVRTLAAATESMGGGKKMLSIAAAMLALGMALIPMAIAVRILGKMDADDLAKGIGAITAFLGAIAGFAVLITKFVNIDKLVVLGPMVMAMAFAMLILGVAINTMAVLSWEELAKAGIAIAGFFSIMALASKVADGANFHTLAAKMIALTTGLVLLGIAATIFGSMSWESLAKAGAAILGFFVIMVAVTKIMDSMGVSLTKLAVDLNGLAVGILIMAVALSVLGSMPIEQIALAVGALFGTLILLGIATKFLGPGVPVFLGFAASLFLIGAATALAGWGLLQVAKAFKTLWDLGRGAVIFFLQTLPMLGTVLAEMVGNFIIGIGSMASDIAAAFGEMFRAIVEEMTNSLGVIFDFFRELFDQLIPFIREYFPQIVALGMELILSLLQGIRDNIGEITNAAIDIILNFIGAITERIGDIIDAGVNFLLEFLNGIANAMIGIADAVVTIIERFAQAIVDNTDRIFNAGVDLLVGILDGVTNGVARFAEALGSILHRLAAAATQVALAFVSAALALIGGIMDAMISAVRTIGLQIEKFILELAAVFIEAIGNLKEDLGVIGKALLEMMIGDGWGSGKLKDLLGVNGAMDDLQSTINDRSRKIEGEELLRKGEELGANFNDGTVKGLKDGEEKVINRIRAQIRAMEEAARDEAGIKSPSRVFLEIGGFIVRGLALGVSNDDSATKSIKTKMNELVDESTDIFAGISKALASDIDINPTITPVLDLSEMKKSSKDISDYFSDPAIQSSFGGVSYSNAESASTIAGLDDDSAEQEPTIQNITFEHTINSPKTLSNAEIFRKTKNQIALAKDELRGIGPRR